MKVELKDIKYYPNRSKETPCYMARIFIDGNLAGVANNEGNGGDTTYYIPDKKTRDEFVEFSMSLPPDKIKHKGTEITLKTTPSSFLDSLFKKSKKISTLSNLDSIKYPLVSKILASYYYTTNPPEMEVEVFKSVRERLKSPYKKGPRVATLKIPGEYFAEPQAEPGEKPLDKNLVEFYSQELKRLGLVSSESKVVEVDGDSHNLSLWFTKFDDPWTFSILPESLDKLNKWEDAEYWTAKEEEQAEEELRKKINLP